jgi:hypothetical protein
MQDESALLRTNGEGRMWQKCGASYALQKSLSVSPRRPRPPCGAGVVPFSLHRMSRPSHGAGAYDKMFEDDRPHTLRCVRQPKLAQCCGKGIFPVEVENPRAGGRPRARTHNPSPHQHIGFRMDSGIAGRWVALHGGTN